MNTCPFSYTESISFHNGSNAHFLKSTLKVLIFGAKDDTASLIL